MRAVRTSSKMRYVRAKKFYNCNGLTLDQTRGEEERASTGCMTDGENSSSMTTRRPRLSIGSADNVKEASEEERADWDGFSNEWNGFSDDVDDERKGPLETTLRPSSPAPPLARLSPAAMR